MTCSCYADHSLCVCEQEMREGRWGQEQKEKRGVDSKRSCNILLSGSSVALRVWWLMSANTPAGRFLHWMRCFCLCIIVSVALKTQRQVEQRECLDGWPRHMFSIEETTGFLSSENGWLFPRSWPDLLAGFYLPNTFSLALPHPVFDFYVIYTCLLSPFLQSTFLSPV